MTKNEKYFYDCLKIMQFGLVAYQVTAYIYIYVLGMAASWINHWVHECSADAGLMADCVLYGEIGAIHWCDTFG